MNCTQFEQLLNANIGQDSIIELPDLREHAADCTCCANLWDGYLLLEKGLPLWKSASPEIDITEQVMSRIDWSQVRQPHAHNGSDVPPAIALSQRPTGSSFVKHRHSRPAAKSGVQPVLAVAVVALLFMVGLLWMSPATDNPGLNGPIAVVENDPTTPSPEPGQQSELSGFVREAGDAYLTLAQHAVTTFSDASVFIPDSQEMPLPENAGNNKSDSLNDMLKDIEKDLQPLQRDVRDAFDFIIRSIPQQNPAFII